MNNVSEATGTTNIAFPTDIDRSAIGNQYRGPGAPIAGAYYDGKMAFPQIYNRELTIPELEEVRWNPYSIANGLVASWDTMHSISAASDVKDLSGNGNNMDAGTLPSLSNENPPVFFPQMET